MSYGLKSFAHPGLFIQSGSKGRCVEHSSQTGTVECRGYSPNNIQRILEVSPKGEGFIPSQRETVRLVFGAEPL
jgi:hypothetical protein